MKKRDKDTTKQNITKQNNSGLLDQYIQRSLANQVQHIDEKAIAMAIKTLLQEGKDNKTLH